MYTVPKKEQKITVQTLLIKGLQYFAFPFHKHYFEYIISHGV